MNKKLLLRLLLAVNSFAHAQLTKKEFSLNFFRNPSIGVEYRHKHISVHTGYYITNFESNRTWKFLKAGISYWFLPTDKKIFPSSFYVRAALLYGLNKDYENTLSWVIEPGYRQMIGNNLNIRLGVAALFSKNKTIRINPTPGISYVIKL
jgi:hypothetical protein